MSHKESASAPAREALLVPVLAGVVAAVIGFGSSFAVVLTGLEHVGASPAQARSGLLALAVVMGPLSVLLSARLRIPVTIAWSTPGAALLAAATFTGRFSDAVGGFVVCGALLALAGVVRPLTDLVRAVPTSITNALLAGVLFSLATAPVRAVHDEPALAVPVVVAWLVCLRFAQRWAPVVALVVAGIAVAVDPAAPSSVPLLPHLALVTPTFTWTGVVSIGVPLFLVTMAGQNLTGVAVLASCGYDAPLRPALVATGAGTVAAAFAGGHAMNLAALSAALTAGPDAGPDLSRRWVAGVSTGATFTALGLAGGLVTSVAAMAPPVLLEAVAGIALLGTFRGALTQAFQSGVSRAPSEAEAVTFLVAASGVALGGVGAPVLALLAGLLVLGVRQVRSTSRMPVAETT